MTQGSGILVSFIIPVYKVEDVIGPCLASLHAPGLDENRYELIFVNDGTPDASMVPVRELAGKHGNVIIAEQENAGVSSARNHGLELARGCFVTFLDADDHIDPRVLEEVLGELEANPDTDILHLDIMTEDGRENYAFSDRFKDGAAYSQGDFKGYLRCTSCGNFYRAAALREAGIRFDESLTNAEDSIFYAECLTAFRVFRFLDRPFYFVRRREGSASRVYTPLLVRKTLNAADRASGLKKTAATQFRKDVFNTLLYSLLCSAATLAVKAGMTARQFGELGIKRYLPVDYGSLDVTARIKAFALNSDLTLFYTITRLQGK